MAKENKERELTNKQISTVYVFLFGIGLMIYFLYHVATKWDRHQEEITKMFHANKEIICHEGTRAHRVSKSGGWKISGEYVEKDEWLLHMNGCKLENKTEEKKR